MKKFMVGVGVGLAAGLVSGIAIGFGTGVLTCRKAGGNK
jgi:hypothetical protein